MEERMERKEEEERRKIEYFNGVLSFYTLYTYMYVWVKIHIFQKEIILLNFIQLHTVGSFISVFLCNPRC